MSVVEKSFGALGEEDWRRFGVGERLGEGRWVWIWVIHCGIRKEMA